MRGPVAGAFRRGGEAQDERRPTLIGSLLVVISLPAASASLRARVGCPAPEPAPDPPPLTPGIEYLLADRSGSDPRPVVVDLEDAPT